MRSVTRIDPSLARALSPRLKYTTPELVFERIEIDDTCAVLVIGGDGEGAYEWVIVKDAGVEKHSNAGYGLPFAALRDGLIEYWPPLEAAKDLQIECMRIVLSLVAAKANIDSAVLVDMLREAEERLRHEGHRVR